MGNLINRLLLFLCCQIFETIESVYRLFYGLATTRLFNEDTIRMVSNRLYILVSIVILFAFAVKLIEAIVNPDLLTDSKKGVTGVLKRTIIGLMLIASVPAMFNLAYKINSEVISTSLVEKIILGQTKASSDSNNTAGVLTSSIIRGFVYPIDKAGIPINEESLCGDDENCNFAEELVSLNTSYQKYVSVIGANPNYEEIADISVESEWDNDQKMYHFSLFILLIVSIYILYQVIILCFDAALRLVNLGILEIMAPLVIVAYMGGGTDYLSKWAKMVAEKFLSIFARIAALAFMALGLNLMFDKDSIFNNDSATFMFKLLVIIGLLRLVKDLPNIIGKIFGVNIKDPGGIKGRLGEMAGIGKMASDAWTGLGNTAKKYGKGIAATTAATAGAAGAGLLKLPGKGIKKLDKAIDKKTGKSLGRLGRAVSYSKFGRLAAGAGAAVSAGVKSGGKGTTKAMQDAYDKSKKEMPYEAQQAEKKRKGAAQNKAYADTVNKVLQSRGIVDANNQPVDVKTNGKVDSDKLVQAARADARNKGQDFNINDLNNDIINSSKISRDASEALTKYSKTKSELQAAEDRKKTREDMKSFVNGLRDRIQNPEDEKKIDNIIRDIDNGTYNNLEDLRSDVKGLSMIDKSVTSDMLSTMISSASGAERDALIKIKAKWDTGEITDINQLREAFSGTEISGESREALIKVTEQISKDISEKYADEIVDMAGTDDDNVLYTVSTDENGQRTTNSVNTNQLDHEIENYQTEFNKAKEKADGAKKDISDEADRELFGKLYSQIDDNLNSNQYRERAEREQQRTDRRRERENNNNQNNNPNNNQNNGN